MYSYFMNFYNIFCMLLKIMLGTESLGYNSTIMCLYWHTFTAKWQARYDDVMVVGKGSS